jgi:hypothetical protein
MAVATRCSRTPSPSAIRSLKPPNCRSRFMELTYLPEFVRPSRFEKVILLLNPPMRRFVRRAIDGRVGGPKSAQP